MAVFMFYISIFAILFFIMAVIAEVINYFW